MKHLYLYNDREHSFLYVLTALREHVGHQPFQAEQCCMIAHENGKCHIKQGDFMELHEIKKKLENLNLKVELKDELYV
jgi:hypothetical protein